MFPCGVSFDFLTDSEMILFVCQVHPSVIQLVIFKVRVPEERIQMYAKFMIPPNKFPKYPEGLHKLIGPGDIALIKMKVGVTLVPGKLVPVR